MPNPRVPSQLIERLLTADTESALTEELHRATHFLGFERFAMGHHVDLVNPPHNSMRITNYDPDWVGRSFEEGFFAEDPVHQVSMRTAAGFSWKRISDFIDPTPRQLEILDAARGHGLEEGYTVPVHVPGEYRGTCSFAARSSAGSRGRMSLLADLIGTYAFEAARQIMRKRNGDRLGAVPKLTERQHDTLVLVGRGKADSEIGDVLGISRATAHEHVENVRRAYGNAQRPHLIARALFDGQISFAEVLGAGSPLWCTLSR